MSDASPPAAPPDALRPRGRGRLGSLALVVAALVLSVVVIFLASSRARARLYGVIARQGPETWGAWAVGRLDGLGTVGDRELIALASREDAAGNAAADALRADPLAAQPVALEALANGEEDDRLLAVSLLRAAMRAGRDEGDLDRIVRVEALAEAVARDRSLDVRVVALEGLGDDASFGATSPRWLQAVVPVVVAAVGDAAPRLRRDAVWALRAILDRWQHLRGAAAPSRGEVAAALVGALGDPDGSVRDVALDALVVHAPVLDLDLGRALRAALVAPEPLLRLRAVDFAVRQLRPEEIKGLPTPPACTATLLDLVGVPAIDVWGDEEPGEPPPAGRLIDLLERLDRGYGSALADRARVVLARDDIAASRAALAIVGLAAQETLGEARGEPLLAVLFAALGNEDPRVRWAAARALRTPIHLGGRPDLYERLWPAMTDDDPNVRNGALLAFVESGAWGFEMTTRTPEVLPVVREGLAHESFGVRQRARLAAPALIPMSLRAEREVGELYALIAAQLDDHGTDLDGTPASSNAAEVLIDIGGDAVAAVRAAVAKIGEPALAERLRTLAVQMRRAELASIVGGLANEHVTLRGLAAEAVGGFAQQVAEEDGTLAALEPELRAAVERLRLLVQNDPDAGVRRKAAWAASAVAKAAGW